MPQYFSAFSHLLSQDLLNDSGGIIYHISQMLIPKSARYFLSLPLLAKNATLAMSSSSINDGRVIPIDIISDTL